MGDAEFMDTHGGGVTPLVADCRGRWNAAERRVLAAAGDGPLVQAPRDDAVADEDYGVEELGDYNEIWRPGLPPGLKTPLCEYCDSVWMACRFCREERGDMRDWSTKGKPKGSQIGKGMQSHGDGKPSDGNGESGKEEVRGGGKSNHD